MALGHAYRCRSIRLFTSLDVNVRDHRSVPAIILATENGHDRIVLALIDGGTDVNARDDDGRTAIMLARNAGNGAIAMFLRDAGAREWHRPTHPNICRSDPDGKQGNEPLGGSMDGAVGHSIAPENSACSGTLRSPGSRLQPLGDLMQRITTLPSIPLQRLIVVREMLPGYGHGQHSFRLLVYSVSRLPAEVAE